MAADMFAKRILPDLPLASIMDRFVIWQVKIPKRPNDLENPLTANASATSSSDEGGTSEHPLPSSKKQKVSTRDYEKTRTRGCDEKWKTDKSWLQFDEHPQTRHFLWCRKHVLTNSRANKSAFIRGISQLNTEVSRVSTIKEIITNFNVSMTTETNG